MRFWDKDRNRYDKSILDDGQCYYNHIYRYCFTKRKWIDITKEINIDNRAIEYDDLTFITNQYVCILNEMLQMVNY